MNGYLVCGDIYSKRVFLVLFLLCITTIKPAESTSDETTPTIALAIFNFVYSWGSCDTGDTHGDFYSPYKFTMGVANNGKTSVLLEEVEIVFVELGDECKEFESRQKIDSEEGLPITLFPQSYWLQNISCPYGSTIKVKIQIKVDSIVIHYGEVTSYSGVNNSYKVWEEWTNYQFYTDVTTTLSPSLSMGILGLGSLVILTLLGQKKRRNLSSEKSNDH